MRKQEYLERLQLKTNNSYRSPSDDSNFQFLDYENLLQPKKASTFEQESLGVQTMFLSDIYLVHLY